MTVRGGAGLVLSGRIRRSWLMSSLNTYPLGDDAFVVSRCPTISGSNWRFEQVISAGWPPEVRLTAWARAGEDPACQESAVRSKPSGPEQSDCRLRYASGLNSFGSPSQHFAQGKVGSVSLRQSPRSALWDAPQGVPHRLRSNFEMSRTCGMLFASNRSE